MALSGPQEILSLTSDQIADLTARNYCITNVENGQGHFGVHLHSIQHFVDDFAQYLETDPAMLQ